MASDVSRRSSSADARTASNCRLIAADPAPAVSATTRAISRARSSAAASDSSSRPVKRDRRLAFGDRRRGVAVALLDQRRGLDQGVAVDLELAGKRAEILQRL